MTERDVYLPLVTTGFTPAPSGVETEIEDLLPVVTGTPIKFRVLLSEMIEIIRMKQVGRGKRGKG